MSSLPLSWSINNSNRSASTVIRRWNINWPALKEVPPLSDSPFNIIMNQNGNTIIRGCNKKLASQLVQKGFSKLQFGMEAVLSTENNHFTKKSLTSLVKRGLRNGKIIHLPYSDENKIKLNNFKKLSSHGSEPQLVNLFQTEFKEHHSLYVFINDQNDWLGAILTSKNSPKKIHTELLLRKFDSPVGVMEASIKHVFENIKEQNYQYLSLGEVPFKFDKTHDGNDINLMKYLGHITKFAYDHEGLFQFKNKFVPIWEPLYICSSSTIKLQQLMTIFIYSNFYKLIMHKFIFSLKKILKV